MAKEQWHNWGRTFIILSGIVFAGGGYAMKIHGNTSDIGKVDTRVTTTSQEHEQDIKKVEDRILETENDVHRIELNAKDVMNIALQSAEAFDDIKQTLTEMQKTQSNMATVQAVNSAKLETLTKDE